MRKPGETIKLWELDTNFWGPHRNRPRYKTWYELLSRHDRAHPNPDPYCKACYLCGINLILKERDLRLMPFGYNYFFPELALYNEEEKLLNYKNSDNFALLVRGKNPIL